MSEVQLTSHDPSDNDLIKALGGGRDLASVCTLHEWEILGVSGGTDDVLIVGKPPYEGDFPKRRKDCSLDDAQAQAAAKIGRDGWTLFSDPW